MLNYYCTSIIDAWILNYCSSILEARMLSYCWSMPGAGLSNCATVQLITRTPWVECMTIWGRDLEYNRFMHVVKVYIQIAVWWPLLYVADRQKIIVVIVDLTLIHNTSRTVKFAWRQGCQICIQIGSDWPQMGQIWEFLRSVSVHFGLVGGELDSNVTHLHRK